MKTSELKALSNTRLARRIVENEKYYASQNHAFREEWQRRLIAGTVNARPEDVEEAFHVGVAAARNGFPGTSNWNQYGAKTDQNVAWSEGRAYAKA